MLKSMGKSKKCIFWMVTFGLMGLTGVVVICILYIYGFLYRQEWNVSFVPICICMVMAIGRVLNNNIR